MLTRRGRSFRENEDGVVLIEALLALPILLILAVGILEFGNMMWQRQQLQVGVRDAARYWSRCRPLANGATYMPCTIDKARNIAVFGNPDGTGNPRVPGWSISDVTITPATPDPVPDDTDMVTVSTSTDYQGSPLFNAVLTGTVEIGYWAQMRYIGW
ncbi:pilus assembly protein [Roseovarius faecimaris]|uniref:Pilus assembly protein n=1 Tax=Roseovarius faecimaris TaxID=2494550 RepID=A0A6I6ITY7_9RHOB|nr:TadE/TadG family type IV pilus assembly protein [Roseovarius faecimaris]QGY00206.1 pilus assembly protein [Roseovarius faecimaris]